MIPGDNLIKCLPGQVVDTTNNTKTSFLAEEAIEFGRPLMRGTNKETQVKNFVGSTVTPVKFLGVSARTPIEITGAYPVKAAVTVIEQGRIWVGLTTGLVIQAGDYAYINQLTSNITNIPTSPQTAIGRFISSGTSDGITGKLFALELVPGFQL